jgi:hypothetical protein
MVLPLLTTSNIILEIIVLKFTSEGAKVLKNADLQDACSQVRGWGPGGRREGKILQKI